MLMDIHLSGQREKAIHSLIDAGKFASAEAVIDEALRLITKVHQERCETVESAPSEENRRA